MFVMLYICVKLKLHNIIRMYMNKIWLAFVAGALSLSCGRQAPEKVETPLPRTQKERVKWFEEARLGVMIHWSLCTPASGRFYGEKVRNSEYAEWVRCHNKVQKADWDLMAKRMPISEKEVEYWVIAAKEGGFKYLTFVTKHHDGVAFWNSKVSDYTYGKLSGTDFDVLKCLKEKCDKYGIVLCAYYSQWLDWEHPNGRNNDWDYADERKQGFDRVAAGRGDVEAPFRKLPADEEYDKYWREKAMPQVAELIKDYGVKLLWFDCWREDPVAEGQMTEKQMRDMLAMVRELDPTVLVNTRLGIHEVGDDGVDFQTMGDNEFPEKPLGHTWETAATFNHSWGYNRDDQNWRSTTYFVREIVKGIYKGGNVMLNIGPRADGSIPQEIRTRMLEIGDMIRKNKVGFYGTYPSPFAEDSQDWGLVTQCPSDGGKTKVYLHVFEWPSDGVIRVNGLKNKVLSAYIPSLDRKVEFVQKGLLLHVLGPVHEPVAYDSVIELEVEGELQAENGFNGEINFGGIALKQEKAVLEGGLERMKGVDLSGVGYISPTSIRGWKSENELASWKVYIPERCERELLICYSCDSLSAGNAYRVEIEGVDSIKAVALPGPKGFNEYYTRHLGKVVFPEEGMYTVRVRPEKNVGKELFGLNWMFVK